MNVVCTNDKRLPEGANVTEGKEYTVLKSFVNNWGQRVYIIDGIPNSGKTSKGLEWHGYDATRFSNLDKTEVEEKNHAFALN